MESEAVITAKENSPLPETILPRSGWNPRRCIKQDSEPNTLPRSYSGPVFCFYAIDVLLEMVSVKAILREGC